MDLSQAMFNGDIWITNIKMCRMQNFRSGHFTCCITVIVCKCSGSTGMEIVTPQRNNQSDEGTLKLCYCEMCKQFRISNTCYLCVRITWFGWTHHRSYTHIFCCNGHVFVITGRASSMETLSLSTLFLELKLYFPPDSSLSDWKSSPEISCCVISITEWSVPFFFGFPHTCHFHVTIFLLLTWFSYVPSLWYHLNTSHHNSVCAGSRESNPRTNRAIEKIDIISYNIKSMKHDYTKKNWKSKSHSPCTTLFPTLQRYDIALIVILNIFITNCIFIGAHAQVPHIINFNESSSNDTVQRLLTSLICDQIPAHELFSQTELKSCSHSRCYASSQTLCSTPYNNTMNCMCNSERCDPIHSHTCSIALNRVIDADNKAGVDIKMFSKTMLKYATPETYSRRWSLDNCVTAYKNWICSMEHRINDTRRELASCKSAGLCSCVEKSCPFFRVYNQTKLYGGQPSFLCQGFQEVLSADQRSCLKDSGVCEH